MSNIKPLTKMKKFFAMKDEVVSTLAELQKNTISPSGTIYTNIRPHKNSLIYFGISKKIEEMSFCLELEYKGVLLIFFYDPSEKDNAVEYTFAFDWTDDEILEGSEDVLVNLDIDEAGLFQQSMVDDLQFLTVELHQCMIQYCHDVRDALRTKINESYGSN